MGDPGDWLKEMDGHYGEGGTELEVGGQELVLFWAWADGRGLGWACVV